MKVMCLSYINPYSHWSADLTTDTMKQYIIYLYNHTVQILAVNTVIIYDTFIEQAGFILSGSAKKHKNI